MAHPVQIHPNLSLHLTDRALNPLLSSASTTASSSNHDLSTADNVPGNAHALDSLTLAANTAFESAKRLGLGLPQRVMVETSNGGPILLHSFMGPQAIGLQAGARREQDGRVGGMTENSGNEGYGTAMAVNGAHINKESQSEELSVEAPPLLIATVVGGSAEELREARRAAVKLERIGRGFQREWLRGQEKQDDAAGDDVGEG